MLAKMVKPDSKGRITLGHLADGVSRFLVTVSEDNTITLEPYAEVPAREKWLFDNANALSKVKRGLDESAAGKVSEIGSFAQYLDEDIE